MQTTPIRSSIRMTRPAFAKTPIIPFRNFGLAGNPSISSYNVLTPTHAGQVRTARKTQLSAKDVRTVPTIFTDSPILKTVGGQTLVFTAGLDGIRKIDCSADTFEVVDFLAYPMRINPEPGRDASAGKLFSSPQFVRSGKLGGNVHHLLDKDGFHYAAFSGLKIIKTTDDNTPENPLRVIRIKDLGEELPSGFRNFPIIEMGLTAEGHIAILSYGVLLLCDSDLRLKSYINFPGEIVCNRLCIDEQGIYVATSRRILKIVWNGSELSYRECDGGWETEFDLLSSRSFARGGALHTYCHGSAPVLMGFGDDPDKLILISRRDELGTKLFAFWRDGIPRRYLSGGSRFSRIADQFRIDFAKSAVEPLSAVHGYGMVLINSARHTPSTLQERHILFGSARSAVPNAMKFSWNVKSKSFERDWLNSQIDSTNHTFPVISEKDGLVYVGHKANSGYQLVAMDWNCGTIRERWILPDGGRQWNTYGGATMLLDDGDFLIGGYLNLNRIRIGSRRERGSRPRD